MEDEILHDEKAMKFYAEIEGEEAYLQYVPVGIGILDFRHTFVPPALRGRGLAGQLVQAGLLYAREHGYQIRPTCSYVEQYFDDNEEIAFLRE